MNSLTFLGKAMIKRLFKLILVVVLIGLLAVPTSNVSADVTFTVDTTVDAHDNNPADLTCNTGTGQCSLRAAIEQAFSVSTSSNPVTIDFSSGISGGTISLNLGTLVIDASYMTIDGGSNNVKISGALLGAGQSIFQIRGNSNTIRYLTIRDSMWDGVQMGDFAGTGDGNSNTLNNVKIFNSMASGVFIHGTTSGGNDNTVSESVIGASSLSDTTCAIPNGNGDYGIYINGPADNTLITSSRIVCNEDDGVYIDGSGGVVTATSIRSSYIGTFGSSAMSNSKNGIHDYLNNNTHIEENVISGNGNYGVWMQGSSNAWFWNNSIGTDVNGSFAIPNGYDGVAITDVSHDIWLGDSIDTNLGNVISGNTMCGISVLSGSYYVWMDGNYIGLGVDGTTVIPNGYAGVAVWDSGWTYLSKEDATVRQFISGNNREGVYTNNSNHVIMEHNTYIGVAADLTTPRGNIREGVLLDTGTRNSKIRPGILAYNGLVGIAVSGNTSVQNRIDPEIIRYNGGLPVDLGNDGHTTNGTQSPPGPNNWMEYPEVDLIRSYGIDGHTCPECWVLFYQAVGDPTASSGGGIYLGLRVANASTGAFSYDFLPSVGSVTMIAYDWAVNGSSEMSPMVSKGASNLVFLPMVRK